MPIIKIISLYAESHLPKKGWLQACIMCETITSNTRLDRTFSTSQNKTFEIYSYICPRCQRKLTVPGFDMKYNKIIQDMIDDGKIPLD